MSELYPIVLPPSFNYIGAFLTFACSLRCTYCINHHGGDLVKGRKMDAKDWIRGLNRIVTRPDLPITLQGGEPTTFRGFYEVLGGIRSETAIDLLTNLEIDAAVFIKNVKPERLRRQAPYASIRVSYHFGQSDRAELLDRVWTLKEAGYSIGVWIVDHPAYKEHTEETIKMFEEEGIDIRRKEFLGPWEGRNHGSLRYYNAVNSKYLYHCQCRTTELLIAPDGNIFRCHSDLYANRNSIGHILQENPQELPLGNWIACNVYGKCNSCDIKVKTNRFQEGGHSSVEIRNVQTNFLSGLKGRINNEYIEEVNNTYGK